MKKLYTIFLALLTVNGVFAQGCLPEGISFYSQSEVDSFQYHYPGCSIIEGYVYLGFDITNVNGLSVLTAIEGDLTISAWQLSGLEGFQNLVSVGGALSICANPSLLGLEGLESLISIGGRLYIGSPDPISWSWSGLKSIARLANLATIGGGLLIDRNDSLKSLAGLDNLVSIGGDLIITNNSRLSSCEASGICSYLADPKGPVTIYGNSEGCNSPPEIAGNCGVTLPCLPFGNYYFFSQSDIDHFQDNYPGCTELKGDVTIHGNGINSLAGLSPVTSIAGDLCIGSIMTPFLGNPLLKSLTGLDNLEYIGGNLYISCNDSMTDLEGLNNLNSIGNGLYIGLRLGGTLKGSINSLTSIEALGNLTSIGGELYIESTPPSLFIGIGEPFVGGEYNTLRELLPGQHSKPGKTHFNTGQSRSMSFFPIQPDRA